METMCEICSNLATGAPEQRQWQSLHGEQIDFLEFFDMRYLYENNLISFR